MTLIWIQTLLIKFLIKIKTKHRQQRGRRREKNGLPKWPLSIARVVDPRLIESDALYRNENFN